MKSKELKVSNLPNDNASYKLEVKPRPLLVFFLVFGIFIMRSYSTYGLLLISLATFCLLFLPSVTLLEFRNDYLVLYNKASKSDCVMIFYDEILAWRYRRHRSGDELIIELTDGQQECLECFNYFLIAKYLNYYAKGKQLK